MNERIKDLAKQAGYYLYDLTETHEIKTVETDSADEWITLQKFAELIVRECIEQIHLECEDFENGNCFADDELWQLVTREYGKNKERGFNPVGMSIHFDKMLKKHFGVEE